MKNNLLKIKKIIGLYKIFSAFFLFPLASCFSLPSIEELSLEEKVGQLLVVHFHGESVNEDAQRLIQGVKVGGIIYYNWANNLTSFDKVHSLSNDLQSLASENKIPIPLLITTDQEGGIVSRLSNEFTLFPGNKALGILKDENFAKDIFFAMGRELRCSGINMNLAPVVDINTTLKNSIGSRSFGATPETVIAFGKKALEGFKEAGILTVLKHFPGHGDVEIDSHFALPIVTQSIERLENHALLPFSALAHQTDAIMTAHLLVPAFDPDHCATLSPIILGYLRDTIGFQGVIISDSLVMEGVLQKYTTVEETAIQALNAGCDILLLGGKLLNDSFFDRELSVDRIEEIQQSIIHAVQTGRISIRRVDEAVQRILKLKEHLVFVTQRNRPSFEEHQQLVKNRNF